MAAEERHMEANRTDGIFGSGRQKVSDEFPVEENNKDNSRCGEIRGGLIQKHSRAKQRQRQEEDPISDGSIWM